MATKERFRLSLRWVCFGLLLTAVVFRFADWWIFARAPAQTEPGQPQTEQTLEATYPTMYYTLPERNELVFTAEDSAFVSVDNRCGAEFDLEALLTRPLEFTLSGDEPVVLIVHTHATEAYTMTGDTRYEESAAYRTADTNYNVVRVGQVIADCLNAHGIATLHDTTLNDLPGYNDSYSRTAAVICRYLEEYPSIQMVIDVHRDAVSDGSGGQVALASQVNGQQAAKLMLVMGTDLGGLSHPNWQTNLSMALKLQAMGEQEAPGLFRELSLCASRYNEHLTPYSMLLEVGSAGNTLEEALLSAEYFAQQLSRLLLSQNEQP